MPSLKVVTIDLTKYLPRACHCVLLQYSSHQTISSLCSCICSSRNASHRVCASLGASTTIICTNQTDCIIYKLLKDILTLYDAFKQVRWYMKVLIHVPSNMAIGTGGFFFLLCVIVEMTLSASVCYPSSTTFCSLYDV